MTKNIFRATLLIGVAVLVYLVIKAYLINQSQLVQQKIPITITEESVNTPEVNVKRKLMPNSFFCKSMVSDNNVDTVSFGFISKIIKILNYSEDTDTMFVSISDKFTSTKTIALRGGEMITLRKSVKHIYVKFGEIPTSGKVCRLIVQ